MKPKTVIVALLALGQAGLTPVAATAQSAAAAVQPNDYSDGSNWLCRPGRDDACAVDLASTVITADGVMAVEDWQGEADAPIDCFYVYPTVSTDPTPHSDMSPDAAELRVIEQQFARFASVCRPYAPSYRQVTLAGLRSMLAGGEVRRLDQGTQYDDARDAFRYYLEHDNDGRGFVLIGHSQGAYVLSELLRQEIDGKPAQDRLVSALLIGATVTVVTGSDRGGSFQTVPLCRSETQTGCVVTYVSFRSTAPPPEGTLFGRATEPGEVGACTNPASLGGGESELHAYLSSGGSTIAGNRRLEPWVESGEEVETPFVSVPGLLSAECASNEHATYFEISIHGDPNDPRVDDIRGDLTPEWGLHLVDMNVAMGDLVDLVRRQGTAWRQAR